MSAPYPAMKELGVVEALQEQFVRQLRAPLAGFKLVADKQTRSGDWGNEEHSWREISALTGGVQISMDFPPIQGDSGSTTKQRVESPIWTKDLVMGGRKWRQLELAARVHGLSSFDPILTQEMAEAMAIEKNRQILKGSGTGKPGSTTGLLNHAGVSSSVTSGGDWTDPEVMNDDIGAAYEVLTDRRHRGSVTLLHNPADAGIFNTLLPAGGGRRVEENMPRWVSRVEMDEEVDALTAYLIVDAPGSYDWIAPMDDPQNGLTFGLGAVTAGRVDNAPTMPATGTMQERRDDLMKTRAVRFLDIGTIRMIRTGTEKGGSPVAKLTFTRS